MQSCLEVCSFSNESIYDQSWLTLDPDPNRLFMILSKLPWHADTLLQMAEYYRHREGRLISDY